MQRESGTSGEVGVKTYKMKDYSKLYEKLDRRTSEHVQSSVQRV